MHSSIIALAASIAVVTAQSRGFNYGAVTRTGAVKNEADFTAEFNAAQALPGTNGGFSSARLYTMIQAGTTNSPISAIPAAISSDTQLFLGMWASSGAETINNEIAALTSAIKQYGEKFTSRVKGISVGSEDLYRISPTGLSNDPLGVGAQPDEIVSYIRSVRRALADTPLSNVPVGHVDTWDVWRNGSNAAVIDESDYVAVNTFPYFQTTQDNSIQNAAELFNAAYDITVAAAKGKPVIVTETGWPVSGKDSGAAEPSRDNARAYYREVGCNTLFGKVDTYWYTLVDANTDTATQPQFGVVGTTLSTTPLFDLSCAAVRSSTSASVSGSSTSASASASSAASGFVTSTSTANGTTVVVVTPTSTPTVTPAVEGSRPNNLTTGVGGAGSTGGASNPTTPPTPTGSSKSHSSFLNKSVEN